MGYELDLGSGHPPGAARVARSRRCVQRRPCAQCRRQRTTRSANTTSTKTKKKPRCNAHALIDKGFDLELSPDRCNVEIIAIAEDLENLRRLGYPIVVVRDLQRGFPGPANAERVWLPWISKIGLRCDLDGPHSCHASRIGNRLPSRTRGRADTATGSTWWRGRPHLCPPEVRTARLTRFGPAAVLHHQRSSPPKSKYGVLLRKLLQRCSHVNRWCRSPRIGSFFAKDDCGTTCSQL